MTSDPQSADADSVKERYRQATALHGRGDLAAAAKLLRAILGDQPAHFDSLLLLGTIALQRGQNERGVELLERAIAINPQSAGAHHNRGRGLADLGRTVEALACFDRAIALQPKLHQSHFNRGNALARLERHDEALASYDHALALAPDYVNAWVNRSATLRQLGLPLDALASVEKALALAPKLAIAHEILGRILADLGRNEAALASYDQAIRLDPGYATAHVGLGNLLGSLGRYDEAIASFDRAIAITPDLAEAWYNRGNAHRDLGGEEEAIADYDCAIALNPNHVLARFNRGNRLQALARHEEARAVYETVTFLRPEFEGGHINLGFGLLRLGRFTEGWQECARGFELQGEAVPAGIESKPRWTGGEPIAGRTILAYANQGLGDTIHFCRYANLLRARGARVVLWVQRPLVQLLSQSLPGVTSIATSDRVPDYDCHLSLFALPLAMGTELETIPASPRYLAADAAGAQRWNRRLPPGRRPRVGLVWRGNPALSLDRRRSIELADLLPLLGADVTWVGLQKDLTAADRATIPPDSSLLAFGDALEDFTDTAAIIENLDLVVSVDTSVAHLAAAMGKPTWILLPYVADWRWLIGRSDSPWYPTARLFRQSEPGNWAAVVERVAVALHTLPPTGGSTPRSGGMGARATD